jgi:hypothetical protein
MRQRKRKHYTGTERSVGENRWKSHGEVRCTLRRATKSKRSVSSLTLLGSNRETPPQFPRRSFDPHCRALNIEIPCLTLTNQVNLNAVELYRGKLKGLSRTRRIARVCFVLRYYTIKSDVCEVAR